MAKSNTDGIYDINIVPFVDIVLVLLVITMLMAPTLYQSSIRVALPEAFHSTAADKITFRLSLTKSGDLYLDQRKIGAQDLRGLYDKARLLDPEVDAIVNADKEATHGQVMAVIDELRRAGMRNIAMGTAEEK